MSKGFNFESRYDVLGPPNECKGDCQGTGLIPIHARDNEDSTYAWLWMMAEFQKHSFDGWHFVPCPKCNEKAIHGLISNVCFNWWPKWA